MLTGTKSEAKFPDKISHSFQIETGIKQGHGLFPHVFLYTREGNQRMEEMAWGMCNQKQVRLGYKLNGAGLNCLTFADNLAISAKNTMQINLLKETA